MAFTMRRSVTQGSVGCVALRGIWARKRSACSNEWKHFAPIRGSTSDVAGILSQMISMKTINERRMVTPAKGASFAVHLAPLAAPVAWLRCAASQGRCTQRSYCQVRITFRNISGRNTYENEVGVLSMTPRPPRRIRTRELPCLWREVSREICLQM